MMIMMIMVLIMTMMMMVVAVMTLKPSKVLSDIQHRYEDNDGDNVDDGNNDSCDDASILHR